MTARSEPILPAFSAQAVRESDRLDRKLSPAKAQSVVSSVMRRMAEAEREAERIRQQRLDEVRAHVETVEMLKRLGRVQDVTATDRAVASAKEYLAKNGVSHDR